MSGAVNDASRSSPAKVLALEESRVLVEGSVREAEWILAKTRIAKEKFDSMGIMKSRNVHGWEKSGKGNGAGQAGPGNEGMQKKRLFNRVLRFRSTSRLIAKITRSTSLVDLNR